MKIAPRVLFALFFALNATACVNFEGGNGSNRESGSGGYVVRECPGSGIVNSSNVRFESRSPAQMLQNYPEICSQNP